MSTEAAAAFGTSNGQGPSRAGFWIGGALIAAGIVAGVLWFVLGFRGLSDAVDDLQRVDIPGTRIVQLSSGRKAAYYEGPGDVPPLEINVLPVGGGPALDVGAHSGSVSYSIGGHSGESVAGFDVPADGSYSIDVVGPANGAQLAVGRGVGGRIVRSIVGGFALVLVLGGAGAAAIVVTATRRSRARSSGASSR